MGRYLGRNRRRRERINAHNPPASAEQARTILASIAAELPTCTTPDLAQRRDKLMRQRAFLERWLFEDAALAHDPNDHCDMMDCAMGVITRLSSGRVEDPRVKCLLDNMGRYLEANSDLVAV